MEAKDFSNYETDRLRNELEQEREFKEMLEESVSGLRRTVVDLERRLHGVDDEETEWRTRFEMQLELNRQLECQIADVQKKLEDLRSNPSDRLSSIRSYEEMSVEALRRLLKQLTNDKCSLQNQLMDYRLRVEKESKAYLKANDERRTYLAEISKVSTGLGVTRKHPTAGPPGPLKREHRNLTNKRTGSETKRGSVRKTERVSRLPKVAID